MISDFCKTYLAAQGVEIIGEPPHKETVLPTKRKPVAPVIVPQYERE
jgi:hypothetical protein